MAKTKDIFKKFTVAAIATVGIMLAGNSLQAQAETVEPEEVTLVSDVSTSDKLNMQVGTSNILYAESFGSVEELPDGSWIGCDTLLPEEAEESQKTIKVEEMTQPSDAEDVSDDATTGTDTATADADASVDVPSQDITDEDANAVKAGEDKILDEGFAVDAVDGVDTDEVETPSTSESKVSDVTNVTEDTDEDDWMYVDFDSEPEVKGDDIITPEEPMVPEEPQPQPIVPETPILTEPTVQPMQTPVVLGDSLWTAPKTGDTLTMIAVCIIVALLAAGVIVLSLQRKRKKEERRRRTQFSPMIRPDHLIDH